MMVMPESAVAFLSNRKLHVRKNGKTQVVESEFERTVRERAASIERRHAWKNQGRGAIFMGGALAAQPSGPASVPVLLTGLTAAPEGALLYSMETDAVSGIFLLDADGMETRLFHTADFRIRHATLDPAGTTLAVTTFHKADMRSNIAVLPVRGTEFSELTEGDSFDQAPQWVPGPGRRIVFQSAGIGRDVAGDSRAWSVCWPSKSAYTASRRTRASSGSSSGKTVRRSKTNRSFSMRAITGGSPIRKRLVLSTTSVQDMAMSQVGSGCSGVEPPPISEVPCASSAFSPSS